MSTTATASRNAASATGCASSTDAIVGMIVVTGSVEQIARIAADQQDDEKHAADDGHGEQRLEQGVRDELHEDDVPVGGGDERAALETVFERTRQRARLDVNSVRSTATMEDATSCRCPSSSAAAALRVLAGRRVGGRSGGASSAWSASGCASAATPQRRARRGSRATSAAVRGAVGAARNRRRAACGRPAPRWRSSRRATSPAPARCSIAWREAATACPTRGDRAHRLRPRGAPDRVGRPAGDPADRPDHRSRCAVSRAESARACA